MTTTQLLMTLALIAVGLAFTQVEGCGQRETMIETLSFSPDNARIAVTKLNARDAQTPMKHYKANVSRTLSWLDAADGKSSEIVHQDLKLGNCGPAFRLWWIGRTSVVCNPANGQLAWADFGGGNVTCTLKGEKTVVLTSPSQPVSNLAYSRSGKYLAASGMMGTMVWETETNTVAMFAEQENYGFLDAALIAFSNNDSRIVAANLSGVHVWDKTTSSVISAIVNGSQPWVNAIATTPNDTVILCTDQWIRRYDFSGEMVASLAERRGHLCRVSADGRLLAVGSYGDVTIYDLTSNKSLCTIPFERATSLALTADGKALAVGDVEGRVTLIDAITGQHRWSVSPPGRYCWPWTYPALLFAGWCILAMRLSNRSNTRSSSHS